MLNAILTLSSRVGIVFEGYKSLCFVLVNDGGNHPRRKNSEQFDLDERVYIQFINYAKSFIAFGKKHKSFSISDFEREVRW
jgi:hypothetical protein